MSFQHFRLGELSLHQPLSSSSHLPQHHHHPQQSPSTSLALFQPTTHPDPKSHTSSPSSSTKQPYGSGDSDDGYTLVFQNLASFQEWRAVEEERQMVEFVKGDTHGSKAVPPRFKDHTKLVCARHSRSGRKKYIKKHPERVRKVPSRKLEGIGCPASISYKTYFDTEQVRACYLSQHSHPTGPANLPFTRRGRKAAAVQEKERSRHRPAHLPNDDSQASVPPAPPAAESASVTATNHDIPPSTNMQSPQSSSAPTASTSNAYTSSVSMIAPLPAHNAYQQPPSHPYVYPTTVSAHSYIPTQSMSHERWENMATLFHSIRENARAFEYPSVSVAALETVLIRLYLESPMTFTPQPTMGAVMQHISGQSRMQAPSSVEDGGGGGGGGVNVDVNHEENAT
ncbi:hypothetical protein AX17_000547 [Amanita inopinata Kibby_2008]|nr:hypothetical protein AX17_000547 [Amanita inopinata Kibby_2008]